MMPPAGALLNAQIATGSGPRPWITAWQQPADRTIAPVGSTRNRHSFRKANKGLSGTRRDSRARLESVPRKWICW